jgi:hypothetical protein
MKIIGLLKVCFLMCDRNPYEYSVCIPCECEKLDHKLILESVTCHFISVLIGLKRKGYFHMY